MSSAENKDIPDATEAAVVDEATKAANAEDGNDVAEADEAKEATAAAADTSAAPVDAGPLDAPSTSEKRKLECEDCNFSRRILVDLSRELMELYEESSQHDYYAWRDVYIICHLNDVPDKHDIWTSIKNTQSVHARIKRACYLAKELDPSLEMVDYVDEEFDEDYDGWMKKAKK